MSQTFEMTYTVLLNFKRGRKETDRGISIDFGQKNLKTFEDLKEAQNYAQQLCKNIRDLIDEKVYISLNEQSIERWQSVNGKVVQQHI